MSRTTVCVRAGLLVQTVALLVLALTTLSGADSQKGQPGQPPAPGGAANKAAPADTGPRVAEGYPNRVQARLEQRARSLRAVKSEHPGMAPRFIISLSSSTVSPP